MGDHGCEQWSRNCEAEGVTLRVKWQPFIGSQCPFVSMRSEKLGDNEGDERKARSVPVHLYLLKATPYCYTQRVPLGARVTHKTCSSEVTTIARR